MLYIFPANTFVLALKNYERPYENPIAVRKGDLVRPVNDGSMTTDFLGWTWCIGPDGRAGWTPDGWCERTEKGWRILADFSALELTVHEGDRLQALHGESGFLFCRAESGEEAWLPDALVCLEAGVLPGDLSS